jgi:hypothetical protein
MAVTGLWVCVRTRGRLRRFLRIGAARDGSVYTTIGIPIKGATVYTGETRMPPGVASVSQDYTRTPSEEFTASLQQHTGFKPSGAIFTKFDQRGYAVMPLPALKDLRGPLLLEQIYPSPLDEFIEIPQPRNRDVVVPDSARSPQNIHPREIEERFGDQPFHLELFAVPKTMLFSVHQPATVGFVIELEVPLYRLVGLFRQDDVDLQRGWLDRTRSLRARFEQNTPSQSPSSAT